MLRRFIAPLLVLPSFLSACGPTNYELWQRESDRVSRECTANQTGSRADVLRICLAKSSEVSRKYGFVPDAFNQAFAAYLIAVAERVDRGELTQAQAEFLATQFGAYMNGQRENLELLRSQQRVNNASAAFWSNFWTNWNASQAQYWNVPQMQQSSRTPVRCRTYAIANNIYTDCN